MQTSAHFYQYNYTLQLRFSFNFTIYFDYIFKWVLSFPHLGVSALFQAASIYCSIIYQLIFFMRLKHLFVIIAAVFSYVQAGEMYLSLPFTYAQTTTRTEHIITVQINRYSYLIDVTIDNHPTFFLNLAQMSGVKQMVDRVDYRKHKDNIFGIMQFTGVERADPKMDMKSRLSHNLYSYLKNILPRLAWFNLQNVQQVAMKDRFSTLSEGTFNFGPSAGDSPILRDLKRYCDYMKDPVVSFQMQLVEGRLFFGSFPVSELSDPLVYSTVKLQNYQNQHWRMLTQSVLLRQRNSKKNEQFYLVKEMIKFKLTVSSKIIVLPKKCAAAFEKIIPGCRFVVEELSGQRLLTCSGLSFNKVKNMELEFAVTGSSIPLLLKLQHLIKYSDSQQMVFYISWGEQEILQIGETLLRQYLLGINYREGLLYYGKAKDGNQISVLSILKWLIIANLLLFIFSLLVVMVESQLRREVVEAVKKEVEYYHPRENGYHMAELSEQTIAG